MFKQNKYTKWYYLIIQNATTRQVATYTEKHHIIPKSLGGSNDKENLVALTAKEHFVCHLLLTKMTDGLQKRSMWHASWTMANLHNTATQERYKISSRIYEMIKVHNARALSAANTGKPSKNKGRVLSREWKDKISNTLAGRQPSAERNAKVSKALTGRVRPPRTAEWTAAQKLTLALTRKICEHCGKEVSKSTYTQYHGLNCKAINK